MRQREGIYIYVQAVHTCASVCLCVCACVCVRACVCAYMHIQLVIIAQVVHKNLK